MIIGYAIIAVPTGIITVEMSKQSRPSSKKKLVDSDIYCDDCGEVTFHDSYFCHNCGKKLNKIT